MSPENFDPASYKGISVRSVFEGPSVASFRFAPHTQERFVSVEEANLSPEGEPTLLFDMVEAASEGISLRGIGAKYGLTHRLVGRLFQSAGIPYASREEAIQHLWDNPQFRERNSTAMLAGRDRAWKDPERREVTIGKLRESTIEQMKDPEVRRKLAESSRITSKLRWQDPVYRAKMAENGFPVGKLMSDPEFVSRLSESRRKQWEDPQFRARNLEISRSNLAEIKKRPSYRKKRSDSQRRRWEEDPEYRAKMTESAGRNLTQLWHDPEFRAASIERSREIMTRLNRDPKFRIKGPQARRERMADPAHREQISELRRQIALSLWEDPEYRTRLSGVHKALWEDPEYRDNQGAAFREARLDPANRDRMVLPTIHGFRSDIGFYAQSAWEANIARVFQLTGRDYDIGVRLNLEVTDAFQDLFQTPNTTFSVDFSTINKRGRTIMYELMAHPLEDPEGWAKLEMTRQQYPDIALRIIDASAYERLKIVFADKINADPKLHGWEKAGFNLKTHPELFSLTADA